MGNSHALDRNAAPLRPTPLITNYDHSGGGGGGVGGVGGGGDAAGEELLQLLGLDPLTANSAAATELLLANFCSSMQMGNENDAFLDSNGQDAEVS